MAHASYGNHSEDPTASAKPADSKQSEPKTAGRAAPDLPAAGPHGKEHLVNEDATPGAGTLPEAGDKDGTDSTSS
ncbi:hypothetical protein [Microvirga pudoricolor]|uniref:hypothetical protein n=1 Tax=Microvirga pudoricolor TaxID=2778729 RepID=UPI001951E8FC|nr:hypothetical protein [Microvirga pudoricolor]MBM6594100.1 hypothetical protein [Microvirga pudoricolor]